jgi:hypothetical protein
MREQPQPEHKIELCTPDTVDLPIINLQDARRPFKIKVTTIRMVQHSPFTGKEDPNLHLQEFVQLCHTFDEDGVTQDQMRARIFPFSLHGKALCWFHTLPAESKQDWEALMRAFMKEFYSPTKTQSLRNKIDTFVQFPTEMIAKALERFNEYMRAEFLEWHIDFLMRTMEKMEVEREAQDLKAAKARSTCEECEEYDHVQGKPQFNASSPIQDLVPLCAQLKNFMDGQDKINKDTVTKFEAMETILDNLDGKVTEVGSSIREVFIMMKMLETQVGQLVRHPMGNKGEFPPQGPETAKATQTRSGEMEDHTKETMKIMTEGPEFEMPSHYMKEVVASVKTKGQSQPVKTKKMIKLKNKPVPKMVRKWVPKIAMLAKSVDPN